MHMAKPFIKTRNKQAGVTLLLAILILAAITAITFSLAAITTIELRSSSDTLRTEPALYATQAVTEMAFFKYKRSVPDSQLDISGCAPTTLKICLINKVTLNALARQFDPAPRADVIPIDTTVHYLFYDPTQPNYFGQIYNSITLTNLNNVSGVTATLSQRDSAGNSTVVRTDILNSTPLFISLQTGHYELAIKNSSSTAAALVQLDAFKTTAVSGQNHLLSLTGTVLDVSSSYLGLTRKYSATIQSQDPLTSPSFTNFALAANGAVASAQNYTQDGTIPGLHFQPLYANDGVHYISPPSGDRYWRDEHGMPTWLEIDFPTPTTIREIDVYTVADAGQYYNEPTAGQTFTQYGATDYIVQYGTVRSWINITGGVVSGNNLVWKKITFPAITTSKIRVMVNAAPDNVARVAELEAWGD